MGVPVAVGALVSVAFALAASLRPHVFDPRLDGEAALAEPAPGAYARALAETQRLNLVPAVVRRATFQPNLFDRLVALGAPLPYPRMRGPSPFVYVALVVLVGVASIAAGTWGPLAALREAPGSWMAATVSGADVWFAEPLGDLASARHAEHRYDDAALLYGAAAAVDKLDPAWPAHQCMSLAAAGRTEEAERALEEACQRGADADLVAAARARLTPR
jgi:hypothetical protein